MPADGRLRFEKLDRQQEVCGILRISKKTLQVYRDKGILPFSRIKHKIFFKPDDVKKLLESNYHPLKRKS